MRLRYTGQTPVSFIDLPHLGEAETGAEFDVEDASAPAWLGRADIEAAVTGEQAHAEPEPAAPARVRKAAAPKSPEASQPAVADPATTA